MPSEYKAVLTTVGKTGDFKEGVLKVNIPRSDVRVTIAQRSAPTPFRFGGWIALTKGPSGMEVLMGDLVLTEDEVNPVMSAISIMAWTSPRCTIISSGSSRGCSTCTSTAWAAQQTWHVE